MILLKIKSIKLLPDIQFNINQDGVTSTGYRYDCRSHNYCYWVYKDGVCFAKLFRVDYIEYEKIDFEQYGKDGQEPC